MNELPAWRTLAACAAHMAEAASAQDWDRLVALDQDFHRSLEGVRANPRQPLSAIDAQEKTRLIAAILDHQHVVRDHVEPWLEHVQPLLGVLSPPAREAASDPAAP